VLSLYRYWHCMRLVESARNMSILYGSVLLCSNLRFMYSISLFVYHAALRTSFAACKSKVLPPRPFFSGCLVMVFCY